MSRKLKLDLHTHPVEALKEKMGIRGILDINSRVISSIVEAVKSSGLNGIAVTEHNNFNHGWVVCLEIMEKYPKENLVILPGVEVDYNGQQFLQIYVPDRYRRRVPFFKGKDWFLVLAHPGYYNPLDIQDIRGIDFDAVEEQSLHGDFPLAGQISAEKKLPVTRSSDAHKLEDIGYRYTELDIL